MGAQQKGDDHAEVDVEDVAPLADAGESAGEDLCTSTPRDGSVQRLASSGLPGVQDERDPVTDHLMPDATPAGFYHVDRLNIPDRKYGVLQLLWYSNGEIRFRHLCDRTNSADGDRGVIICAPLLQIEEGNHRVVCVSPPTIEPSIHCPDCGTHGHVTNGSWVPA